MGENVAKCVINMLREKEHQADLVGKCWNEIKFSNDTLFTFCH